MRSFRMLLGQVGAAALVGSASAWGVAAAAHAAGVWIEVSPTSVATGAQVAIRADCIDNTISATATSKAFGTVTLRPGNTLLLGEANVPVTTRAGTYDVTLSCRGGTTALTVVTVLTGTQAAPATVGPHTGGGYLADRDGLAAADVWLIGTGIALAAAGVVGVVSARRPRHRRRTPIRSGASR